MSEKEYTFREIESEDIFTMLNIIDKLGVEDCLKDFKDIYETVSNGTVTNEITEATFGLNIAVAIGGKLIHNIGACKDDLYKLLSDVSNLSVDEIKHLKGFTIVNMIMDFCKKDEFVDFFGQFLKSTN